MIHLIMKQSYQFNPIFFQSAGVVARNADTTDLGFADDATDEDKTLLGMNYTLISRVKYFSYDNLS